ncbi:MAG: glycoside hydrolase family 57 protein [Candidatus Methanomethylicia archaeon]
MVKYVAFMFKIHQPVRLKPFTAFNLSNYVKYGLEDMYDHSLNREVFIRASKKCYIPATKIILEEAKTSGFKATFSVSGVWIESALHYCRDVIELLRETVNLGFGFAAQTYYHSISPILQHLDEMAEQIAMNRSLIEEVFNIRPNVTDTTEFIYNNDIGLKLWSMNFNAAVTEGAERILAWRSSNHIYNAYGSGLKLLVRNYRLSDDIAFRFSNRLWDQYPLTADKYAYWIAESPGDLVFIAIDYETFGEHQWPETGIMEFLKYLPRKLREREVETLTLSEAINLLKPVDVIDVPPQYTLSWANAEKDLTAWIGNSLQIKALQLYEYLEPYVKALGNPYLKHWRYMGISDNLYYISSKYGSSGDVHMYFSPFKKDIDAYTSFTSWLILFYREVFRKYSEKISEYAWKIYLPEHLSYRFSNTSARSLNELYQILKSCRETQHILKGYIQKWIREVFLWNDLASSIDDEVKQNPNKPVEAALKVLEKFKA